MQCSLLSTHPVLIGVKTPVPSVEGLTRVLAWRIAFGGAAARASISEALGALPSGP